MIFNQVNIGQGRPGQGGSGTVPPKPEWPDNIGTAASAIPVGGIFDLADGRRFVKLANADINGNIPCAQIADNWLHYVACEKLVMLIPFGVQS